MTIQSSPPPAIDPFDTENHLSYAQAGKAMPEPVSPTSVWRYATKGKRGIKLPTIPTKSGPVTTRAAIRWWFARLQLADQQPTSPRSRRQLDPELEAECEAAGI